MIVGRHSDPTPDEIQTAGQSLDNLGTPGWLVVSEGIYYSNEPVKLLVVRQITRTNGVWEEAEHLWHEKRASAATSA